MSIFEREVEPGAWGWQQTGVALDPETYWLYALENPHPDLPIAALRIEPCGADTFAIAGITLGVLDAHPFRHERLQSFRIQVPEAEATTTPDLKADIDLGIIVRRRRTPPFEPGAWLEAEVQGWGEARETPHPKTAHVLDITASRAATLEVGGHAVPMETVFQPGGKAASADGAVRVEVLGYEKTWLHVTVEDAATGEPTPVRVHFRAPDGRYLPPYGHRNEVNLMWFEDYGADAILGSTEYAYVPGAFAIELPVGEVYVEIAKGFEYKPLRQRLEIAPAQRELTLRVERPINLRRQGWVTADTHVHFLSPTTAHLEAAAEGLNLLNLLASQWGDLFTNVGDITGAMSPVSQDDTLVWVGTENRQHILGHMSLLGGKGAPVFPMTTGGPDESGIGDAVMTSMADWADRCRAREGLVILPHFPNPQCENVADLVLGKIDGVELRDFFTDSMDTFGVTEWYRYLNLGYRMAAVGGTDKMMAGLPVGCVRTYAHLQPGNPFTFETWAEAVRAGRTFTTTGPLLLLTVDGEEPGATLTLPAGGGAVSATARVQSMVPFHEVEIVANGEVVARQVAEAGTKELELTAEVPLNRTGWVAARCLSRHTLWHAWPIHPAAHTSPVYVDVAGSPRPFNAKDAKYMLAILRGGLLWLDTLATPYSAEAHAAIKGVFERAVATLEGRLAAEA
ncbi:MAG: CehA/McbA family metallohydrolase [Anaerolineae bacterium]|nr:CehA/McbA family metallohydrolase [Anaerolineae bacterium]